MTARRIVFALFRAVGVLAALLVIAATLGYLFVTSPIGTRWAAHSLTAQARSLAGVEADIGGLDTDIFTYVNLRRVRVALPDSGPSLEFERLQLRMALWRVVTGRVNGIRRIAADSLVVTVPLKPDTAKFVWSIVPYLPYVPEDADIRGFRLRLLSPTDTMSFALKAVQLRSIPDQQDSSLYADINLHGEVTLKPLGTLPFAGKANLFFRGSSLRIGNLVVSGPGFLAKGHGYLDDLVNGPYQTHGSFLVDLSRLPSEASGIEMSGTVNAEGDIGWDGRPRISMKLESATIATPWAALANTTLFLNTSETDSTLSLRGATSIAEGNVGLSATMIVPPASGPLTVDFAAVDVDLDSVARIPAVKEALAGTDLRGEVSVRWRYSAQASIAGGFKLSQQTSRVELSTKGFQYGTIPIGTTSLVWNQTGPNAEGVFRGAGTSVHVTGTAKNLDDVALSANLRTPHLDSLLQVFGVDSLDGDLDVQTTITGALRAPTVGIVATLRNPVNPWMRLPDLQLNARMTRGDTVSATLTSVDSVLRADAIIVNKFTRFASLKASIGPLPFEQLPGGFAKEQDITGSVSADVVGAGLLANPYLRGSIRTTPVAWHGQQIGTIRGDLNWFGNSLTLDVRNGDDTFSAQGRVAADSGATSQIDVQWENFDLGGILSALTDQPAGKISGMTDGTISARWTRLVVNSLVVQARLDRASLRLGQATYELADPPSRFSMEKGVLDLAPTLFRGSNDQRLHLQGSISRSGEMSFRAALDSFDVGNAINTLTDGKLAINGKVVLRAHVGGTLEEPVANGRVTFRGIRWKTLEIDSAGALATYSSSQLNVPEFSFRFPFGEARGSFRATASALGLADTATGAPDFALSLVMKDAGAVVPNWEGLRSGTVSISGELALRGRQLADISSYSGSFRLDSLAAVAPFNRVVRTTRPATVTIGESRYLASPLDLAMSYRGAETGEISISQPPGLARPPLDVSINRVSLEDLRHTILPLLNALDAQSSVPEDLSGEFSGHARWDMNLSSPRVDMNFIIREPTAYLLRGDSLDCVAAVRDCGVWVESANFYSAGDTLNVTGFVDLSADTLLFHAYTANLELVPVLTDLLPPLRTYQPPPPLPTTSPFPGFPQQIRALPTEARGATVNAPLTTFDRLVRARRGATKHPYAATLPMAAEFELRGTLEFPLLFGNAQLFGAYLEIEALQEPIWLPDTLSIRVTGKRAVVPPARVFVGAQQRETQPPPAISLERAEYSLSRGEFIIEAKVERATFSLVSTEPVFLPPRWRLFKGVLEPLLRAYYTEPIGVFTASATGSWRGTKEHSNLNADVVLYSSTLQYPIADPQAIFKPRAPTSLGPLLDNTELNISLSMEDSLVINNNLSKHATLWAQMNLTGRHYSPNLQGNVQISPGSVFRYLGRDFVIQEATVNFPDPTRFAPEIEVTAQAKVVNTKDNNAPSYDVTLHASGVVPNLVKTEMTAEERPSGEVIVNQLEIMQILIYGQRSPDYLAIDAQGRLNTMLKERGYATLSSALGSVLPIDQVTVRESADNGAQQGAGGMNDVEVEVGQNVRLWGQKLTFSAVSPVGQLSSVSGLERAEVRWTILERPPRWPNLESLSLTIGQNRLQQAQASTDLYLQNELTSGLQLRVRFR
ncbi:MAG TPA: translocation/assembly module TamB domain-containing protein [Candidatus Latescibacteria bacterium]|nr:translocation/assembly module TamB domain-containing protein [Candidatus Latescibacterota bacterium]